MVALPRRTLSLLKVCGGRQRQRLPEAGDWLKVEWRTLSNVALTPSRSDSARGGAGVQQAQMAGLGRPQELAEEWSEHEEVEWHKSQAPVDCPGGSAGRQGCIVAWPGHLPPDPGKVK